MSIDHALCALIDHTLLRPDAVGADIDALCDQACAFAFRTVCVQPVFVARAARNLAGSTVGIAAVVAFPHGASITAVKVFETTRAVADGATEVDVVANLGWIAAGDDAAVGDELGRIVAAAGPAIAVKVILETALFPDARKEAAARAAVAAGAAYVKTSTGYGPGGATVEDVALLRRIAGTAVGVKASGGIKTRSQALALVAAGASRIGASSSIALVTIPDA